MGQESLKIDQKQDTETERLTEEAQNMAKAALLEAEEKVRQRKERIELWRKEKAAKEVAENKTLAKATEAANSVPKKHWSLEDDDDDGEEEVGQLPPIMEEEKAYPACKFKLFKS